MDSMRRGFLSAFSGIPVEQARGRLIAQAEAARAAGMNQQRLYRLLVDIDAADLTGSGMVKPREALRQASAADPDPGWRCEACGTAVSSWSATCPHCRAAGYIGWGNVVRPRLIGHASDE